MIENSKYPNGSQIICLTDGRGSWSTTTEQSVIEKVNEHQNSLDSLNIL